MIGCRQTVHGALQMHLHLLFGLRHEPQAGAVADSSRQRANGKRGRIPKGVQYTGSAVKFPEPFLAPSKVIHLFGCRPAHGNGDGAVPRRQRLSLVEGLGPISPEWLTRINRIDAWRSESLRGCSPAAASGDARPGWTGDANTLIALSISPIMRSRMP